MLAEIFYAIMGCSHKRTTFPLTSKNHKNTYVVCLECGKEFGYNWDTMTVGKPLNKLVKGEALRQAV